MAKRRNAQERDEAIAHEQAEARREALLAQLKAHEAAAHPAPSPTPSPDAESTESAADETAEASVEPAPAGDGAPEPT